MSFEFIFNCVETQAELTNIEALDVMIEGGIRTVVPSSTSELAKFNLVYGLDFCEFEMGYECSCVHSFMLAVFRVVFVASGLLNLLNFQLFVIDALIGLK